MKAALIPTSTVSQTGNTKKPNGVLHILPIAWVPYAELIRLHKPVGILNIYFPYLFGCLIGACVSQRDAGPAALLTKCLEMLLSGFLLRSMGCAWNDIVDADVDRQTERCKSRPMARGAISVGHALKYTFVLFVLWCWTLYQFAEPRAILYAIPVPFLTMLYPFGKRFTFFPQLILGITLSMGILVGAAQFHMDFFAAFTNAEGNSADSWSLVCFFCAYVLFALIHDTIYGFQDIADDRRTGALSMSILFAHWSTLLFTVLGLVQVGTLYGVGWFEQFGTGYYIITCGGVGLMLALMTMLLDVESPKSCWKWFQIVSLSFGTFVFFGLCWQYATAV